ncbi:MAG: coenzyme F420-0:L-glutamate ligase [Candidatus Pacebacteria bacterium]|nr:coenzyme F420-0:L-glutamate ligase [Candidatus Paceibacterota bacterium]MCF7863079.1 coenzyme F420-0:L-glutamate ligase [Candidatus Paceibacterota bacterium]
MKIQPIKTRVFKENENLVEFIKRYIKKLPEKSIIVVTSKIVALSEGRIAICKDEEEKIKLIKKESDFAIKTKYVWLTIKDGMVMSSSGVDESNANGKIILLPKDSFRSADLLRREFKKIFKIKQLGVLITDSRLFPLRAGVVGVALGYAGFKGIRNYVGKKDIFGRKLKMSKTDIADSLATSAVLCMGEGKEQYPLALVLDVPVEFVNKVNKKELIINPREDIYQPLFEKIKKVM